MFILPIAPQSNKCHLSDLYAGRQEGLPPPGPHAFLCFCFPPPPRPILGLGPRTDRMINYAWPRHVGVIVSWNDARNYGVIFVMDDYSARGSANADWSSQLFCHISNFVDGEDCTLDVLDSVQFTVMWDYERERWHAVSIAAETQAAFEACKEKLNMSPTSGALLARGRRIHQRMRRRRHLSYVEARQSAHLDCVTGVSRNFHFLSGIWAPQV